MHNESTLSAFKKEQPDFSRLHQIVIEDVTCGLKEVIAAAEREMRANSYERPEDVYSDWAVDDSRESRPCTAQAAGWIWPMPTFAYCSDLAVLSRNETSPAKGLG